MELKNAKKIAIKDKLVREILIDSKTAWRFKDTYLCLTAKQANSTIKLAKISTYSPTLQYSIDRQNWKEFNTATTITLKKVNDDVFFRGKLEGNNDGSNYTQFALTGKIAASGNIMSFVSYDEDATICTYNGALYSLFRDCTALTDVSNLVLPMTTLTLSCYAYTFYGCTSLTKAPKILATTLAKSCCESMFQNCTALIEAPELLATTVVDSCYDSMFEGCTALEEAPYLRSASLARHCYYEMFKDCTALNLISVNFKTWDNTNACTFDWVSNVSEAGIFDCSPTLPETTGPSNIPEGWILNPTYLCFTALEDNSSVGIDKIGQGHSKLEYSLDSLDWKKCTADTNITLAKNSKVYFRGLITKAHKESSYTHFIMAGKIASSGNIISLFDLFGDATVLPYGYEFYRLFQDCAALTVAPELPAESIEYATYAHMFQDCTGLTECPTIGCTQDFVPSYGYSEMFRGCTGITESPALPAGKIGAYSYSGMFRDCTSLVTAGNIAVWNASYYGGMQDMFYNCTSLVNVQDRLYVKYGYNQVCQEMYGNCKSLVKAPIIPKPDYMPAWMYQLTFNGCSSLNHILVEFDTWNWQTTNGWVSGVAPQGIFICSPALTETHGNSYIPNGWTYSPTGGYDYLCFTAMTDTASIRLDRIASCYTTFEYSLDKGTWTACTQATNISLSLGQKVYFRGEMTDEGDPSVNTHFVMTGKIQASGNIMSLIDKTGTTKELPYAYAFNGLFEDCTGLETPPTLPATRLRGYDYAGMFAGCTNLKVAPRLPATTLARGSYKEMFMGCISLTTPPALSATALEYGCYENMFYGCIALASLPKLPATTLQPICYASMFEGCSEIKISATKTGDYKNTYTIPFSGTGEYAESALDKMFTSTGGTFTGTPEINKAYYAVNSLV